MGSALHPPLRKTHGLPFINIEYKYFVFTGYYVKKIGAPYSCNEPNSSRNDLDLK